MALTRRRLQFLDQLVELYQRTSLPVHYETLANALGVSKWTAYDMLKEIEKLGFVTRSYEVNTKETGRSQVVFSPTEQATHLIQQNRTELFDPENWDKTLEDIKKLLKKLKGNNVNVLIRQLLKELPNKATNIEFCSYMIGSMLVYLRKIGGKTETFIQFIVSKAPNKDMGVGLFIGSVLGTIIQTINDELGSEAIELISKFFNIINDLSSHERAMLSKLLQEVFI